MVYIFPYDDLQMLRTIRDCIDMVNGAAIPHVSLPSYQLTQWQQEAAAAAQLDIICGFQARSVHRRLMMMRARVQARRGAFPPTAT